ncbi:MAG: type II 3-dehydroquinate dehydratase [Acholeplasma sp.]|nr:type II 3-dehydroquinate dehydratase [Acholeplasma sp.]
MRVLIINGPNLNMLGKRNRELYGEFTLNELNKHLKEQFKNVKFTFFQTNSEGKIINKLHKANRYEGIIINAGAYTHTSIAIRDALELVNVSKVAVHLSNINEREDFRKTDYIKDVVDCVFMGEKKMSYEKAIKFLLANK